MDKPFTLIYEKATFLHQPEEAALNYVVSRLAAQGMIAVKISRAISVQRRSERAYDVQFSPCWSDGSSETWVMSSQAINDRGWLVRECLLQFIRECLILATSLESEDVCWELFTNVVSQAQQRQAAAAPRAVAEVNPQVTYPQRYAGKGSFRFGREDWPFEVSAAIRRRDGILITLRGFKGAYQYTSEMNLIVSDGKLTGNASTTYVAGGTYKAAVAISIEHEDRESLELAGMVGDNYLGRSRGSSIST